DTAAGCSVGTTTTAASTGGGGSGRGGGTDPSGSMGETRPGERMRRGSMSPPSPASLDDVGEPWKDSADGDLGGSFLPQPAPPPVPPPAGDAAAAAEGSG